MIHRMLWWEGVLSLHTLSPYVKLAAVVIRCSGARKGVLSYASCMQAAVMIHRMLVEEEGCAIPAAMQARCCCDSQSALVARVCYPALSCTAAVVIHRMLWLEGCAIPACCASCCHDPQALVERRVCYPALPCKLAAVGFKNALVQEVVSAIHHACKLRCVIHRDAIWWKKGAYPCCHACKCCC
jgi:hypothetical protein